MFEKMFGKKQVPNAVKGALLAGALIAPTAADGLSSAAHPSMERASTEHASTDIPVVNVDAALKQPAGPGGPRIVVNEGGRTAEFPIAPELISDTETKPAVDLAGSPLVKEKGSE